MGIESKIFPDKTRKKLSLLINNQRDYFASLSIFTYLVVADNITTYLCKSKNSKNVTFEELNPFVNYMHSNFGVENGTSLNLTLTLSVIALGSYLLNSVFNRESENSRFLQPARNLGNKLLWIASAVTTYAVINNIIALYE